MEVSFLHPQLLWLLLVLPLWVLWYVLHAGRHRVRIPLTYRPTAPARQQLLVRVLLWLHPALWVLVGALLIFGLARPVVWHTEDQPVQSGIDLFIMMDISESMRADDLKPNRLTVAKEATLRLLSQRPNDQVGLGIFGAGAVAYVPLTFDHSFLRERISFLQVGMIQPDATTLGYAIGAGILRLGERSGADKALLLVTDGGNNAGDLAPEGAVRYARKQGIRTFILSLSNPNLPENFPDAQKASEDHAYLTKLAEIGGGQCVLATDAASMPPLVAALSALRPRAADVITSQETTAVHHPLLWAAALLLVLAAILQRLRLTNPLES